MEIRIKESIYIIYLTDIYTHHSNNSSSSKKLIHILLAIYTLYYLSLNNVN